MTRLSKTLAAAAWNLKNTLPILGILLFTLTLSVRAQSPTDNGTPLGLAPGSPEGTYALSGFENVNLYSGGLSFSLPLLQIGGRGSAGYSVQLPVQSHWIVQKNEWYDENESLFTSLLPWSSSGYGGAGYGPGTVSVRYSQWKPETCIIGAQYFTTYRWASVSIVFTAPDGTEHELVDQATLGQPTSYPSCSLNGTFRGPVFVSRDEPGMTFIADAQIREAPYYANGRVTGYLKMPDGTVYRVDAIDHNYQYYSYSTLVISWIRDANGNKTTFGYTNSGYADVLTSIKDSLNHQVTIEYGVTEAPYGICDRLTYRGYGGAYRVIHISSGNMSTALKPGSSIQTYHQLFPELDGAEDPFDPYLITSIWLPDSDGVTRRYRLLYNSYGELARVELPTGGAIEYDWTSGLANGTDGVIYPVPGVAHFSEFDGSLPQIYRRLVTRRAYDVGNALLGATAYGRPETQNYDHSINNAGYVSSSHLNANNQQLSVENHFFYGSLATSFFSWEASPQYMPTYSPFAAYRDGREYQTDYYAANGQTLLRRETQSWDQSSLFWWSGSAQTAPANSPFVKETATTLADSGQVTKSTNINPQTGQIMIDQFGNPLDTWIYDYGQGAPGGLLRHMHTEFMTVNPVNGVDYTNRTSASSPHMLSLPTRMSIYDASETERARTTIEYDNYSTATPHAGLMDRTSISGFDPSYTTNYSTRGNSTATTRYFLTNGSVTGSVSGYVQYDIAGNQVKTIDARGNPTFFDFSDCFGTPDGNARLNAGSIELNGVGQYTYAFASVVTNALGHTSYSQFDYYLGKTVDSEDANGTTYSGFYNDVLDRPTQTISGANRDVSLKRQTLFSYDDVGRSVTQTTDFNSFGETYPLRTQSFYDGLGRTTESRQFEGGSNYIAVKQRYDSLGRSNQVSNPFRNNETPIWSTTAYDELSRVTSVTTPDNSAAVKSYSGNSVTITDQTGRKRKSVSDALGRLIQVFEDPNGVNWLSNYTYDVQDNLTGVSQYDPVSQYTQTRNFSYDSLKRVLSTTNPESGTVNYVYDEQGNVLVQTDARGVSRHFSYDALNRITRRWYNGSNLTSATVNNNPALPSYVGTSDEAKFVYDSQSLPAGAPSSFSRGYSIGRLVAVNYGTGASAGDYFGYDVLGRAVLKVQQTSGVNYQVTAAYNNGGARTTTTYPSGHVVNYNYDQAGRLGDKDAQHLAMTGNLGDGVTRSYATGMTYSQLGSLQQEQFGTLTPLYHKLHYNVRGQLNDIRLSSASWATDQWNWNRGAIVNYYATTDLSCQTNECRANSGTDNNGNLIRSQHWTPANDQMSSYNWTEDRYAYDSVTRLKSVAEYHGSSTSGLSGQDYAQVNKYDRWGNRTIDQNLTSTNVPHPNYTADPYTNRLIAPAGYTYSYDPVGNQTSDNYTGQGARTYDAENRLTQAQGLPNNQWQTYTYDAEGNRIKRNVNGVETWQLYGMSGELLAEYQSGAAPYLPATEYGYRGGELLTTITSGDTQRLSRFITNLYYGAKQRDPSTQELQDATNQLAAAGAQGQSQLLTTASQIARSLFTSTSYETSPYRSDVQYVADLYYAYLQRGPDDGGLGWWAGQAAGSRVNVCNAFEASGEFQTLVATLYGTSTGDNQRTEQLVNNFYLGAYGRNATTTELQQQRDALNAAAAQGQAQVQAQAETFGRALFAGQVNDASLSNTQYVTNLYEGFLQRGPDAGGLGFWSGQASVGQGRQGVLNAFATCSAFRDLTGTLYREASWLVADQVGTPRMIVDKSGSLASMKRHDYLPFGEELFAGTGGRTTTPQGYSGDNVRQKFTGYERDSETGLDYAHARYHASKQGRFTGADRVAGSAPNPQSWNGYTYTLNNPLNLTDPTGLFVNAEYGSDPGRDSDPFLDISRKRIAYTVEIERALAIYQQMVDKGLENLKLKQQQKKKEEEEKKKGTDSVTVKAGKQTIVVTVQQMNEPAAFQNKKINGQQRTGVGVQLTFTVTDGKGNPLSGATVVEKVDAATGGQVIQNPDTVPLDSQGRGTDWVSNSAPNPTSRDEARALVKQVTSPFVTDQKLTLTITTGSGSVIQITQLRSLTNMTQGRLNAVDPALGTPGYSFTMQHMTARVLKR